MEYEFYVFDKLSKKLLEILCIWWIQIYSRKENITINNNTLYYNSWHNCNKMKLVTEFSINLFPRILGKKKKFW